MVRGVSRTPTYAQLWCSSPIWGAAYQGHLHVPGVPRARALGLRWADLAASTHGHLQGDTESVQVRAKLALAQDFTGGDIS